MRNINLSVSSLDVGYKQIVAKNISFSVREGEILTIIGPNGSGKSTILKTLAGYLPKKNGQIVVCGKDSDKTTAKERAKLMSVLLTERIKTEYMTCREVVEAGRYPYTGYFGALSAEDKKAADEAIELTQISELSGSDFSRISDGQRQRVLLARAISQNPRIMILDEPVSYLDIKHKLIFLDTLKRLAKERGIAVIMSMHEIELAREISDSVLALKDGTAFMTGASREVLSEENIKELFDISDEMYKIYLQNRKEEEK